MKTEKQRLTRITTTLREKFPDGTDIFGYNGITKEVLFILLKIAILFRVIRRN